MRTVSRPSVCAAKDGPWQVVCEGTGADESTFNRGRRIISVKSVSIQLLIQPISHTYVCMANAKEGKKKRNKHWMDLILDRRADGRWTDADDRHQFFSGGAESVDRLPSAADSPGPYSQCSPLYSLNLPSHRPVRLCPSAHSSVPPPDEFCRGETPRRLPSKEVL